MNRRSFLRGLAVVAAAPAALKASAVSAAVPKQAIYGRVFNLEAYVVNPYDLIYRVSDRPISSIGSVYDGGVELALDGNDPTYDALRRARIFPGHVRTCVALGLIRFGVAPCGVATGEVFGVDLHPRLMRERELFGAADRGRLLKNGWLIE